MKKLICSMLVLMLIAPCALASSAINIESFSLDDLIWLRDEATMRIASMQKQDISVERAKLAWALVSEEVNVKISTIEGVQNSVLKAAYVISVPDDLSEANEIVRDAFAPFEEVYVLEHSYLSIGPILGSQFSAVGFSSSGVPAECVSPFQIATRIFAYDFLDTFEVSELPVDLIADTF